MKLKYLSAAAAIGLLAPLQSQAATIILSDDFQAGVANPANVNGSIPGWTKIGANLFNGIGTEDNAVAYPTASEWAYFQTNQTSSSGMFRTTTSGGLLGQEVKVLFDLGGSSGAGNLYTGTFTVSLWDGSPTGGGTQLASLVPTNPAAGVSSPITLSHVLTANTTGNLFVQFNASVTPVGSAFDQAIIDNVLVTIPEPSAALLGAFGALGLLRRRRA